jgi:TM2 domain-containing membrane protein YozV
MPTTGPVIFFTGYFKAVYEANKVEIITTFSFLFLLTLSLQSVLCLQYECYIDRLVDNLSVSNSQVADLITQNTDKDFNMQLFLFTCETRILNWIY